MPRRRIAATLGLLAALLAPPASADPPHTTLADPPPTALASPPRAAVADLPHAALRSGEHPGYGRVVLDLPQGVTAELRRQGGGLAVRLTPPAPIDRDGRPPRNVRAIVLAPGRAELVLAAGARFHRMQLGRRLVIDVMDPAADAIPASASAAPPRPSAPRGRPDRRRGRPVAARPAAASGGSPAAGSDVKRPPDAIVEPAGDPEGLVLIPDIPAARSAVAPAAIAAPAASPASPATKLAGPAATAGAAPVTPVVQAALPAAGAEAAALPAASPGDAASGPIALSAAPAPMPGGVPGRAMALPFAAGTAAASWREGGMAVLVFDRSRPIDMAAMKDDPVFGAGSIQLLPAATVLRLPLAPHAVLRLVPTAAGWTVAAYPSAGTAPAVRAIRPVPAAGGLELAADAPGAVVTVPDPATGGIRLAGTQLLPGQALAVARITPELALLPGFQGVVVRPIADAVTLRATGQGFRIGAGPGRTLILSPETPASRAEADASRFSRRFAFPDLDRAALRRHLLAAIDAAAATPAQARGPARLAVARAMLALGMGPEAQAVLGLAAQDDPRLADDPDRRGLAAIAALVAGRPGEAAGLDDPALAGFDDIALWRAVRSAMTAHVAPGAAAVFAAEAALPLAYPKPLRDHVLRLMAGTMIRGGERAAARQLLDAAPADRRLDLARGMLADADARATGGDPQPALAIYDRLAAGADRRDHARAAIRAVELRLARLGMPPAQGADALEALLDAWRGDRHEPALRRRIAALRAGAGQWRRALATLRRAGTLFPGQQAALHDLMIQDFARAMAADAKQPLPPLTLVALAEENPDLVPPGAAGQDLASRLADRLAALDLPARAASVLARLAAGTPPGPARAAFGARLAEMRLAGHDPAGALAALADSAAGGLSAALGQARTLTYARAAAASGDLPGATAALAALGTPAALGLRADLLETAKDWPAATAALRAYADRTLPAQGTLDADQAQLMLRLASAAGQAGDEATLASLRQSTLQRLPAGPLADMFRLLTEKPLGTVADLPRVADAVKLARAMPAALKGLTH